MNTLLLDQVTWDLVLDINGNIAVATEPYSQAQDAASECRLFAGEAWYDLARGVPYWVSILGQNPPLSLVRAYYQQASLLVPGVVKVSVYFSSFASRWLTGQIQLMNSNGQPSAAAF